MNKLRVGIIGTGGIALAHATGYEQAADLAQMTACCDIDIEKAKNFAKAHGIPETSVYRDCREMIQNEQLDCVSVCTMNSVHKECSIAALSAGIPVLCEKPMAMNAGEAQEMYDLAKRRERFCRSALSADSVRMRKSSAVLPMPAPSVISTMPRQSIPAETAVPADGSRIKTAPAAVL